MSRNELNTEQNIQKLISSSLNADNKLDEQKKEMFLNLLLHKMEQQKEKTPFVNVSTIGLSVLWIVAVVLVFTKIPNSLHIVELIKFTLSLSLFIIPVSSIVIIFKSRTNEKNMV